MYDVSYSLVDHQRVTSGALLHALYDEHSIIILSCGGDNEESFLNCDFFSCLGT